MNAAGLSLILKRILASVLFANFLFLSTLLRDRGKDEFSETLNFPLPVLELLGDHEAPKTFLQLLGNQWRFKTEHKTRGNLIPGRSLLSKTADNSELLSCDDLPNLVSTTNYINSGWTKAVYQGNTDTGRPVALKIVNLNGKHVTDCLANQRSRSDCYAEAAEKVLKEIVLLHSLRHPNIIELVGYCIPKHPLEIPDAESAERLAVITELGEPLELIRMLQMDWEERLGILFGLSQLLDYLSTSGFGSIGIRDFRRQQFVTVSGTLKIVDVDDFVLQEPRCSENDECRLQKSDLNIAVKCSNGFCSGYNELQNLHSAATVFFKDTLPHGAPEYLKHQIQDILEDLSHANLSATDLRTRMEHFARQLAKKTYTGQIGMKSQLSGFKSRAESDLPGLGDYPCVGSRNMVGCSLSVASLHEAQDICLSQSACKAFVWTSDKTWTGRSIVHFKNNVSSPSFNSMTFLYIRNTGS